MNENKYSFFEKTFNVPDNSDIKKISGKFETEMLYVTVPKQVIEEKKEPFPEIENRTANGIGEENKHEKLNNKKENTNEDSNKHGHGDEKENEKSNDREGLHEYIREKGGKQASLLKNVVMEFKNNKGIVITAILAFALGVLVAHKFESYGHSASLHNTKTD